MSSLGVSGRMCVDVTSFVGQPTLCFPFLRGLSFTIRLLPWLVAVGAVVSDFSHSCLAVFNFLLGDNVNVLAFLDRWGGLILLLAISVFIPGMNGIFPLGVIKLDGPMGLILSIPSFPHRWCILCCDCSCGDLRLVPLPLSLRGGVVFSSFS